MSMPNDDPTDAQFRRKQFDQMEPEAIGWGLLILILALGGGETNDRTR